MGLYDHKDMEVFTDRDHPMNEIDWVDRKEQTPGNVVPDSETDKEVPKEEPKAS